uniref:Integrase catalytic region n=1 Tax=Burkholderia sp. (strain CCGE1003) TaxID=640512 RepID=E1T3X8_BURSG
MSGFRLRRGMAFEFDGIAVQIHRIWDDGTVTLEQRGTMKLSQTTERQLLDAYRDGRIVVSDPLRHERSSDRLMAAGRPFSDFSHELQQEAIRRKSYLDALSLSGPPVFTPSILRPAIRCAALSRGDEKTPSPSSIYRWWKAFERTQDIRSLLPRNSARGPRGPRTSAAIIELYIESLTETSKLLPRLSLQDAQIRLKQKLERENCMRSSADRLSMPSMRTLQRLFRRLSEYDVAVLCDGVDAANRTYRITKSGVPVTRILERVEVDHTPQDLFVIDGKTGLPCGRPTLTILIDVYSRMVLGYYVSFNDTSTLSVMRALRHAILPKTPTPAVVPGIVVLHSWVCYGRPEVLVTDNGSEFHSDALHKTCLGLGIQLLFCPARQPRFKGTVERFLKTLNHNLSHRLPGTSLERYTERGEYDPTKHAVLTIDEYAHVLEKWVLDEYAQKIHTGIGTTPWEKWCESARNYPPDLPANREEITAHFGISATRSLRHDGILLNGLRYADDALLPIMKTYGEGVSVNVLYDPDDLAAILVRDPDAAEYIKVPAIHPDYAKGLRLASHKLVRRRARSIRAHVGDQDALLVARQEINEAVSALARSRKLRRRRQAAKIAGVSNERPTGIRPPRVSDRQPMVAREHTRPEQRERKLMRVQRKII